MRERYFRVSPRFWRDARGWGDVNQNMALYLLTNEHRTTEGLYYLPKGWISEDTERTPAAVDKALDFLREQRFAFYDDDARVVFVRNALKYQAPATEKQVIGALSRLAEVPATSLRRAFLEACERHCQRLAEAIRVQLEWDTQSHPNAISDAFESSVARKLGSSETQAQAPQAFSEEGTSREPATEKNSFQVLHGRGAA